MQFLSCIIILILLLSLLLPLLCPPPALLHPSSIPLPSLFLSLFLLALFFLFPFLFQTKNASHFAAWSSCLLSQEMFRKAQLAGGGGMERSEGGVAQTKGEGVEGWAVKTQETIASVKKGVSLHIILKIMWDHVRSCAVI